MGDIDVMHIMELYMQSLRKMATFEKVSYEQWKKDVSEYFDNENDIEEAYANIKLPRRATIGSAGYDLFNPLYKITLNQGETITDFNFNIFIKDNSTDILTASYTASTLTDASPTIVLSGSYFYCGSEPELDIYSIYGTISYRYQSNTYTRYFDFGSEVVSASQVDTSMATLYQSYGVPHS